MESAIENVQFFLVILDKIPFSVLVLLAFATTFIENLFPPAPSDILFVTICIIVGNKGVSVLPILAAATLGATLGFWVMYLLGRKFELSVIESNRIRFISRDSINKVRSLFSKWGIKLVIINRFMSGTRAVISFFAGMSALDKTKTIFYSGVSSLVYYGLLAYAGFFFGKDWKNLLTYLKLYEKISFSVAILIVLIILFVWLYNKFFRKGNTKTQ